MYKLIAIAKSPRHAITAIESASPLFGQKKKKDEEEEESHLLFVDDRRKSVCAKAIHSAIRKRERERRKKV